MLGLKLIHIIKEAPGFTRIMHMLRSLLTLVRVIHETNSPHIIWVISTADTNAPVAMKEQCKW